MKQKKKQWPSGPGSEFPGWGKFQPCSTMGVVGVVGVVGLSENSVPLNPMVNDHYPY